MSGLFTGTESGTVMNFIICIVASLVIGAVFSLVASRDAKNTKSFLFTIGILPAVVCVIIMMVNGNVGAGVAVAGAFSLVRFRSNPGTAKEVVVIFMAMCAGLVTGMGYILYAGIFTVIMALILLVYGVLGNSSKKSVFRTLRIAIPEDLDYTDIFDDIFEKYTKQSELVSVRTANMGSIYKLKYDITLRDVKEEKALIDELRKRNGNLEISVSRQETASTEM